VGKAKITAAASAYVAEPATPADTSGMASKAVMFTSAWAVGTKAERPGATDQRTIATDRAMWINFLKYFVRVFIFFHYLFS
jgi:hypothetical protein